MISAEENNMIKYVTSGTLDKPLGYPILPGTSIGSDLGLDPKLMLKEPFHLHGKNLVPIHNQVFGNLIKGKCIPQLLNNPLSEWMSGYIEMSDDPSFVINYEKDKQDLELDSGNNEKVHCGYNIPVISKEGHP